MIAGPSRERPISDFGEVADNPPRVSALNPPHWFVRPRIVRCSLALFGMFAWLCAAVVIRHGVLTGSSSRFLWGTAICGVLTGIAAWVVSLRLRDTFIDSAHSRVNVFLQRGRESTAAMVDQRAGRGLVVFGCLLFAIHATWVSQHQDAIEDDDQIDFLTLVQEIHTHGGLTGLWGDLWSGRFREANRHPLFLALLSLHPTIPFGRALSLTLAAATLVPILYIVWRRMGPLTAGLLSVLVGTNGVWLYHAPRVVCESLLTGLAGLLWLTLWSSRERESAEEFTPPTWGFSVGAGILSGFIQLTKGTGLLLFAGTAVAIALSVLFPATHRRRGIAGLVAFTLSCVLIASPLLVRNSIRFGSSTYNVNSYLLWVDAYESPNAMAERMTLAEARTAYLSTHSTGSLIEREASGLAWEAFIGLRTLGPAPWDDARVLFGLPLFLLGLLGLCFIPRFPALVLLLWTGLVWVTMAWYVPIAAGDRFAMPLLIPWLTAAALGMERLVLNPEGSPVRVRALVMGALLWGALATLGTLTRHDLWSV